MSTGQGRFCSWPDWMWMQTPARRGDLLRPRGLGCDNVDTRQVWINLVHLTKKKHFLIRAPRSTTRSTAWLDVILAQSSRQEKEQEDAKERGELKAGGKGGRRVKSREASNHLSSSSLHPGGSLHRSLIVDGAQVVPGIEEQ